MNAFYRRLSRYSTQFMVLLVSFTLCGAVNANTECDPAQDTCREVGEWSIGLSVGLGYRSNPLLDGDDIPLILLPSISYYGDSFFVDNLDVGYTLIDTESSMLNLLITPSFDRVLFEQWDISNILVDLSSSPSFTTPNPGDSIAGGSEGAAFTEILSSELKKREFSILGGIEYSTPLNDGQLQFNVLKDISDVHSGSEIRLAYAYPFANSGLNATFGLTWKDKSMTDYYYGVDQDEVVDDRGYYQAGASLNPFIRLSWQQQNVHTSTWRFVFEYQKLDSEIADSPIVDKDHILTLFIGKQFSF
ncbi:MipA/OmpV family protein [Aliikangiella marina]|uniref:MipA/OmpV family protein n=1 Tax=Aliikangiella marina TaxID=1712262 RepID=A0A545TD29_9GAMM|nr:MipA/OmpV family protein [Aliikangiella marina]TQV75119.1 MipA/OmpV family protein [Aliikangiella marina]